MLTTAQALKALGFEENDTKSEEKTVGHVSDNTNSQHQILISTSSCDDNIIKVTDVNTVSSTRHNTIISKASNITLLETSNTNEETIISHFSSEVIRPNYS